MKLVPQFLALDVKAECRVPRYAFPVENDFALPSPSWTLCLHGLP